MKKPKLKVGRQAVLVLLIMLVITSGIISWVRDDTATTTADAPIAMLPEESEEFEAVNPTVTPDISSTPAPTPSAIDRLKEDRDRTREELLGSLEEIKNDDEIAKQTKYATQETIIESTLKSKGYKETLATVDENTARITVNKKGLKKTDVAIIMDIVKAKTGYPATKIFISEL